MPSYDDMSTTVFITKKAKEQMDADLWAKYMNPDVYSDECNELTQERSNEPAASKLSPCSQLP